MKNSSTIKIKALGLLVVFSLNMVLGFACSVGLDLGYNRNHHSQNAAAEHSPGKDKIAGNCHSDFSAGDSSSERSDSPNDTDCCSNGVVKFFKLDKNTSASNTDAGTPALWMVRQFTYQIELLQSVNDNSPRTHHFGRNDYPPLPDIRIAIQSFLI